MTIYLNDGWTFYSDKDLYGYDVENISNWENTYDQAGLKAYIENNGYQGVSFVGNIAYLKQVSFTISEGELDDNSAVDTWILNDGWTYYNGKDFPSNDAEVI